MPAKRCKHCNKTIERHQHLRFWLHAKTRERSCGEGTTTFAEPKPRDPRR